jgi:glycerophosphoryl diester phosphodiesterase
LTSIIGHRGAPAAYRENTLEAFLEAVRLGADGVELDIRRAVDGALAVHHDAVLPSGAVLRNIAGTELPTWVPTLPDVFDALDDSVVVDVEIKNMPNEADWDPAESIAAAAARLIAERGRQDTTLVTSFNLNAVDVARSVAPSVRTGWLTLTGYDQRAALETVIERGHQTLLPGHEAVTGDLVDAAHGAGVEVVAWTVDEPERMQELADMGVDAVITNVPDVAVAALRH